MKKKILSKFQWSNPLIEIGKKIVSINTEAAQKANLQSRNRPICMTIFKLDHWSSSRATKYSFRESQM